MLGLRKEITPEKATTGWGLFLNRVISIGNKTRDLKNMFIAHACRWSYGVVLWEIVTLGKLMSRQEG